MKTALATLIAVLVLATPSLADWDPGGPSKWVQLPDLDPTGIDVNATGNILLADDFLCISPGPITEIHLWGSWRLDNLPFGGDPTAVVISLSIHGDIPANQSPTGYSMPGEMLWQRAYGPGEFTVRPFAQDIDEGWMDPPDQYLFPGDHNCWQYNFFIDPVEAFFQDGTEQDPIVYWMNVQAQPMDQDAFLGWKTSLDHFNDDAVWGLGQDPFPGPWNELRYPLNHPMEGQSIDLAFVLNSDVPPPELDFGDAPDPSYPTVLANDGARHIIVPGWFMGGSVDPDPNGQPDAAATGDDNDGNDDEDGVVFTSPLVPGNPTSVDVTVSQPGLLNAWIDFDGNGSWLDPGEQIFTDATLLGGLNSLNFTVPAGIGAGVTTFARFRYSTLGGLTPTGQAPDGEVEDSVVLVEEPQSWKWEQPPDLSPEGIDVYDSYEYILADDFLCTQTGLITDIRIWGSWLDDVIPFGEDPRSVTFTFSIHADIPAEQSPTGYSMPGELLWLRSFLPGSFQASVFAGGIEEGWLTPPADYFFPADWTCWVYDFRVPEQEAFRQIGNPANPVVYWLDVKATPGDQFARFGWKTSIAHWNDDAVWAMGYEPWNGPWEELRYPPGHPFEPQSIDLAFALNGPIEPLEYDFGDAPDPSYPTWAVNGGASHLMVPGIHLGGSVDSEPDGQPNLNATGDDLDGNDDDDGVVFTSLLRPGQTATVDVTASVPGFLDAWIDYGQDGSWAESTDAIFVNEPLNPGVNNLSFTLPLSAKPLATSFARFRFSQNGGLGFTGQAPDGEVEDYELFIEDKLVLKWIQDPDLSSFGLDVAASPDFILADDFLCTDTSPITDFYIWGSWLADALPFGDQERAVSFTLSIHSDIPANQSPTDYSMPGDMLWMHTFNPGEFEVTRFAAQLQEGWLDPPDGYIWPGDTVCWLYKFHVDPHLAFLQRGTIDQPMVYWLDLQARPEDPLTRFGWKSSVTHWNDDAVWGQGGEPYLGPWFELRYPPGHEFIGQSIDLAFALYNDVVTDTPASPANERSQLHQNVPNPFNPKTTISYEVRTGGEHVKLTVYDTRGRHVRTLVEAFFAEGPHELFWDARDDGGRPVPSGVYFYRLKTADVDETRKMLLLR